MGSCVTDELKQYKRVVLMMANHGDGEAPDNAKKLLNDLRAASSMPGAALKGVKYSVFGLGWAKEHARNHHAVSQFVDESMERLGGKRMTPIGIGNSEEDPVNEFEEWKQCVFGALQQDEEWDTAEDIEGQKTPKSVHDSFTSCQLGLLPEGQVLHTGTVSASKPLLQIERDSQHMSYIEVEIEADQNIDAHILTAGDHIAVYPQNSDKSIASVVSALHLKKEDLDTPITLSGDSFTLGHALKHNLDVGNVLSLVTVKAAADIAEELKVQCAPDLHALTRRDVFQSEIKQAGLALQDLMQDHCELPQAMSLQQKVELLQTVPALLPRFYYVSTVNDDTSFRLAVKLVQFKNKFRRTVQGPASSYLHSLSPGDKLRYFVRQTNFDLPENSKQPVIMIATDIGIAPIIGFLKEREIMLKAKGRKALGDAILFYGCPATGEELYQDVIQHALEQGLLTKVHYSYWLFAPHNDNVKSIIESVLECKEEIQHYMAKGASIYTSGDSMGYGEGVREAIQEIVTPEGDDGESFMRQLVAQHRFIDMISRW